MICNNFQRLVELVSGQMQQQCEACRELNQIRATLLANFGKNDNPHGFVLKDEGPVHGMVVEALKGLTQTQSKEEVDLDWKVDYLDDYGEQKSQIVKAPTSVHAGVLFGRMQIPHQLVRAIRFYPSPNQEVEIHDSEPSTGRKTDK